MIMTDNQKHIAACAGIAFIVMAAARIASCRIVGAALAATLIAMAAGCIKEYCDNFDFEHPGNRWSWSDIRFDAIGTAIGTILGMALWL